jgi:hypothetical protein
LLLAAHLEGHTRAAAGVLADFYAEPLVLPLVLPIRSRLEQEVRQFPRQPLHAIIQAVEEIILLYQVLEFLQLRLSVEVMAAATMAVILQLTHLVVPAGLGVAV